MSMLGVPRGLQGIPRGLSDFSGALQRVSGGLRRVSGVSGEFRGISGDSGCLGDVTWAFGVPGSLSDVSRGLMGLQERFRNPQGDLKGVSEGFRNGPEPS